MNWLADNATLLASLGGLVAAALVVGWIKTTEIRLLYGVTGLVVCVAGLLGFSWWYVSPQEEVRNTLFATAEELERDDVEAVLDRFIPEAVEVRATVRLAMSMYRITEIDIKPNLEITISESGRRATAKFNAVALGSDKAGILGERRRPFYFLVFFERDGDRWLIESYEEHNALRGFQREGAEPYPGLPTNP